ncbi:MAG: hypothetical protein IT423_19235 [Pirellulaceae bacterium]|nr:hypothetical protein [Pirellulaceae bacterium]
MSYSPVRPAKSSVVIADGEPLDLGNRELAAFLAWLVPGAGHYYQRRYLKSAIFCIAIMSTFLLGMLVGGGRCVYASWNQVDARWQYVLQAGVGLPAMPAAYQAYRVGKGLPPAMGGFMAPPNSVADLSEWNEKSSSGFDMGTLYTMIAGLLNILVIFDAWGGPLPPPVKPTRGKDDNDADNTESPPGEKAVTENTVAENQVAKASPV